ncbi:hypothetical protein FHU10_1132 [Serratia fonticola]|uniref:Uncharacterized protein n=1 Tax=Serratia fonticola TaxID=47917 RepID=A0A559T255_SERFO|nr:hypothetical protein [Serratia fonticola]TQI78822.1 hypothetical protein FHU09_1316 [Serratia fonticola]TQI99155.1 hypothetical protein FHU11_4733 [Serratia fonticola]TVZ68680.1 hypothetical protein FHU10_1132 [Serratia fonticola]
MAADKNASEFPHWLVKSTITQKHFLYRDVAKSRSYIQWISRCSQAASLSIPRSLLKSNDWGGQMQPTTLQLERPRGSPLLFQLPELSA